MTTTCNNDAASVVGLAWATGPAANEASNGGVAVLGGRGAPCAGGATRCGRHHIRSKYKLRPLEYDGRAKGEGVYFDEGLESQDPKGPYESEVKLLCTEPPPKNPDPKFDRKPNSLAKAKNSHWTREPTWV